MSSSLLDRHTGSADSRIRTQQTFLTCEQQADAACFVEQEQRDNPPDGLMLLACGGKQTARVPPSVRRGTTEYDAPL